MKLNIAKKVILTAITNKINTRIAPLNMIGHAGIGKTQILRDIAKELNIPIHIFRLGSMQDVGDMMGAPFVNSNGETKYGTPDWFTEIQNGGILFLDEINRAKPTLTDAVMQILDMGKFNSFILPDNCYVISAMNPSDENYDVNEFDQAVIDRCVNIGVTQNSEDVINYIIKEGFDADVVDLITLAKDDLNVGKNVELPKKQFTPRNIRQLNVWMPIINLVPEAADELVMGCIGPTGFNKWKNREILRRIPTAEQYFKNPNEYKLNKFTPIEQTILLTRICVYLKDKKVNDKLKTTFSNLLVKLDDQLLAYVFRLSCNDMGYINKFIDHNDTHFQEKCNEIINTLKYN